MAQNITLLGASYTDVPAVELPKTGGGTASFTDVTPTTAVATDVLQGKYFFTASGVLTLGTNQGGSGDGYVWQDQDGYLHLSDEEGTLPIVDSLTVNGSGTYTAQTGHVYNPVIVPGGTATAPSTISGTSAAVSTGTNTLTLTKTVSVTPQVTAGYVSSGTAGNTSVSLTASVNTRSSTDLSVSGATVTAPSGYYGSSASKTVASGTAGTPIATKGTVSNHSISVTPSVTNTTGYITGSTKTGTAVSVSASELVSGNLAITQNGTGINVANYSTVSVAVPTSSPTLITKNITANGTYNASSDSADGYSSVTVNVSGGGGASNIVTGTFTTGTTAGATNITLSYSGSGYPISLSLFVSNGAINSSISSILHQGAVLMLLGAKADTTTTPTYSASSADYFCTRAAYKSSSTNASTVSNANQNTTVSFATGGAQNAGPAVVAIFKSSTILSVYTSASSSSTYGLLPNTQYTYTITYSS